MPKALLLGAGFSTDLGMPLVSEFSKFYFKRLSFEIMEKVLNLHKKAHPYGFETNLRYDAFDKIIELHKDSSLLMNYENFLKEIQKIYFSSNENDYKMTIHYIFGLYYEQVYELFKDFSLKRFKIYNLNKNYYSDLFKIFKEEELWILSLNHDLLIECLCLDNKIPISFGDTGILSFPLDNYHLNDNLLDFSYSNIQDLSIKKMKFFRNAYGINLIKLHGALNEFFYNDKSKIIHTVAKKNDTSSSYFAKNFVVNNNMKHYVNGKYTPIIGELAVSDIDGECQFFGKSILTGGYKYSKKLIDKQRGEEKMFLFKQVLSEIDEVIIIGYGFNDEHINNRLDESMILNENLKMTIVNPDTSDLPYVIDRHNHDARISRIYSKTPEWIHYRIAGDFNIPNDEQLKKYRNFIKIKDNFFN